MVANDHSMQTLQLNTRLSNKSWVCQVWLILAGRANHDNKLGDENSDEEDPFAEVVVRWTTIVVPSKLVSYPQIDEGFSEDDLDANLQRDKYARLCNTVNQLIDELTPSAPDFQLRDACDQMVDFLLLSIHRDEGVLIAFLVSPTGSLI